MIYKIIQNSFKVAYGVNCEYGPFEMFTYVKAVTLILKINC